MRGRHKCGEPARLGGVGVGARVQQRRERARAAVPRRPHDGGPPVGAAARLHVGSRAEQQLDAAHVTARRGEAERAAALAARLLGWAPSAEQQLELVALPAASSVEQRRAQLVTPRKVQEYSQRRVVVERQRSAEQPR